MKTVCDSLKKKSMPTLQGISWWKLGKFDEKTLYFLMHEFDTLIFKTKYQIENQLSTTSQPNHHLENVQQNVPTASYNSYNCPISIHSASLYYFQPSSFSYSQQS